MAFLIKTAVFVDFVVQHGCQIKNNIELEAYPFLITTGMSGHIIIIPHSGIYMTMRNAQIHLADLGIGHFSADLEAFGIEL